MAAINLKRTLLSLLHRWLISSTLYIWQAPFRRCKESSMSYWDMNNSSLFMWQRTWLLRFDTFLTLFENIFFSYIAGLTLYSCLIVYYLWTGNMLSTLRTIPCSHRTFFQPFGQYRAYIEPFFNPSDNTVLT